MILNTCEIPRPLILHIDLTKSFALGVKTFFGEPNPLNQSRIMRVLGRERPRDACVLSLVVWHRLADLNPPGGNAQGPNGRGCRLYRMKSSCIDISIRDLLPTPRKARPAACSVG